MAIAVFWELEGLWFYFSFLWGGYCDVVRVSDE